MTMWTAAQSMSRSVKQLLFKGEFNAQVLGVFEHACNLVTPNGDVIAVVVPLIGDGPFTIVVDNNPAFFAKIETGTPVTLAEEQLQLGGLRVDLRGAAVWEPRPDWHTLRQRQATILACLPLLRTACHCHAPDNTFLALFKVPRPNSVVLSTARKAAEALQDGWAGNQNQLQIAGKKLAGLGSGLTPAGDDFLAGVMFWAWLTHPAPDSFCRPLLDVAAPHTTTLSAAFLRAAAQGECSNSWHVLLKALTEEDEIGITAAAQKILLHGATSGADTLAGFLYLPTMTTITPQPPLQP